MYIDRSKLLDHCVVKLEVDLNLLCNSLQRFNYISTPNEEPNPKILIDQMTL